VNAIQIPQRLLSVAFWASLERFGRAPLEAFVACEANRSMAANDTGSVTAEDAIALWRLARCFRPSVVVEVGTFIGRSTTALRLGSGAKVYTCDKDNDCFQMEGVITHPKTSSTEMLKKITEKVDMFFLDGRISREDVELIAELVTPNTVFVMDDFEGMEKGVHNVVKLSSVMKGNLFIHPKDGGVAVSIPPHMLTFSTQ
jgi:predicted O-methyltransferase YrrM